jgi:hypothetical protein
MIDVPAILSDQSAEISKSGELSDRGITLSKVRLLVAFND